jgi:transcription initiation factor TFIIB
MLITQRVVGTAGFGTVSNQADFLQDAKDHERLLIGRDPRGIAAGALYIASILTDNRVTQREITMVAGATEVTVRNRYKELVRELKIEVE